MSTNAVTRYTIGVIAGDGIGPEVINEGRRVLEQASSVHSFALDFVEFPWGSDFYRQHGSMMPDDAHDLLEPMDSAYFGAVGAPDLPDHVTAQGLILELRRQFDLYVNIRPTRLFRGVDGPTRFRAEEVDFVVVRENSEGEYVRLGGRHGSGEQELATQISLFSAAGIDRIMRHAFELARERSRDRDRVRLTSVTKSNALGFSMTLWDDVAERVAGDYPDVEWERMHVDAVAYRLVKDPSHFDVLVASNLFGDILSDLGAALHGSLGLSASANIHPGRRLGLFEPVHGSAPDITGKGIANPIGAVWCGALMLEHLGERAAAAAVLDAVGRTLADGVRTPDLGGDATTSEVGDALCAALSASQSDASLADMSRLRNHGRSRG